jgi:heme-degrading monooxygenase HmoA
MEAVEEHSPGRSGRRPRAHPGALAAMIARIWHGVTRASDFDAYWRLLQELAIPDYRRTPGNRGVRLFRQLDGDRAHFLTLSYWTSLDAIRAFAGDDIEVAKYYPEDRDFLLEFEPTVQHFEVIGPEVSPLESS